MSYVTELEIESPESWQDPEVYRFTDHPRYHDIFYPVVQRLKNEGGYGIRGQPALYITLGSGHFVNPVRLFIKTSEYRPYCFS